MQKMKQQDGNWWVEDDDGLRPATDLEIDLWTRLVSLDGAFGPLKEAVKRMMDERIACYGSLAHLLGTMQRAKREELRETASSCGAETVQRTVFYARTFELTQALTACAHLIGKLADQEVKTN